MLELAEQEKKAIASLKRLAKRWPPTLATDETGRVLEYAFPFEANQKAQVIEGQRDQLKLF